MASRTSESAVPRLYGAVYSVYVRIVRLALAEKGVAAEHVPVDVFAKDGVPEWYRALHPFAKIPAFEHGDLRLFEASVINRYVDEAFAGPALQPEDVVDRARMNQIIGILDAYAYRPLVWDIYVERCSKPARGEEADEARIAEALPVARQVMRTLAGIRGKSSFLAGEALTLADLHAFPMMEYFRQAPEGSAILAEFGLDRWHGAMSARPSAIATPFH